MALEDRLQGLQLRGVIALTARATERVLPLAEQASNAMIACREAVTLALQFADGAPGTVLWRRKVVTATEALSPLNDKTSAIGAVCWAARAGNSAYQITTASRFASSDHEAAKKLMDPLTCARKAISHAENAAGTYLERPFYRDLGCVQSTHSGVPSVLGPPIDATSRGPLGFLWAPGEAPDWWLSARVSRRRPRLITALTALSSEEIRAKQPDFVCFYVESDNDHAGFDAVIQTLDATRTGALKPRPGFVVFVSNLRTSAQLELISRGAIVLTGAIAGQTPESLDEFKDILEYWLTDTLLGVARDQGDAGTGSDIPPAPIDAGTSRHPDEINARYKAVLGQLSATLPRLAMS